MNPDYAIFVFPRPWTWLGLALFLLVFAGNSWFLWRQRQLRRRVAHIAEPLIDICRRHGFIDEAEQIERDVAPLRGGRRKADKSETVREAA